MKLTLTKVRKVRGHDDSLPFDAILMADGKAVAELFDDGWGGEVQIRWLNNKQDKAAWDAILDMGRQRHLKEHPEEGLAEANKNACLYGLSELSRMAGDALMIKDMTRLSKKNIMFTSPEMGIGEYKTMKAPFDQAAKDWVLKKTPNAVFINEMLPDAEKIKKALKLED